MSATSVLLVGSDICEGDLLAQRLRQSNYEVVRAEAPESAMAVLERQKSPIVLLHLDEPAQNLELLRKLRLRHHRSEVAAMVATRTPMTAAVVEALEQGANDLFSLPVETDQLVDRIEQQLSMQASDEGTTLDLAELLPEVARNRKLRAGDSLSHYQLLALIGEGFWGEVFRAFDKHLLREVAIKIMKAVEPANGDVSRHLQEARTVAQIEHRGVTRVYEVGLSPGYIVMELVSGRPLADLITDHLPVERVRNWTVELLEALAAVHERGIVHRDVKPSNVQVTNGGHVKLMDFGLAGRPDISIGNSELYGTPLYASPEHFDRRLGPITQRSDLFAVGAVLYEMLTGFVPFHGQTFVELAYAIVKEQPQPLEGVPQALRQVCLQALAKKPIDRFPDATTFARALRQAI